MNTDNDAMSIENIDSDSGFIVNGINTNTTPIIKVVGVGGGGGNAVGYMYRQGVENVKFVVANTDLQALENSPVPDRVLLGHTGLGAGNKPDVAYSAAQESIEAIGHMFDDTTKMAFITAGLGGGTGTGAAPVVAQVAKERGVLTIGIVTIPFFFEGMKKISKALKGANEMSKYVDALLLINNEQLINIYPDLDFDSAFDKADDVLATAARSISELITTRDARINLDFNDVDSTLRDGGTAIISCGYGEGENRVDMAIQDALNSPLLSNKDILGAQKLLFNLYYSRNAEHRFQAKEMSAFTSFVSHLPGVDVIYGVAYDESLGDKVKVTILAAGFDMKVAVSEPPTSGTVIKGTSPLSPVDKVEDDPDIIKVVKENYGPDKVAGVQAMQARNLYVILSKSQLDDDRIIEGLEKYPAYKRTKEMKARISDGTTAISQAATQTRQQERPAQSSGSSSVINIED